MRLEFNFESLGSFFSSFRSPDREINIPRSSGSLRLQKREDTYALRFGSFGRITYREFSETELVQLKRAIDSILETEK